MLKGEEVYVPSDCCEESLREIIKEIKNDPDDHPFVRLLLAEWQVLNKDLLVSFLLSSSLLAIVNHLNLR
jgi:hypothetical protein